MKPNLTRASLAPVVVVAATAMLALSLIFSRPATAQVAVGQPVTLDLKTVDGKALNSESLKGKVVLLDFWATWCGPCMQEVPHMKQVNEQFGKKGLQIIGISLDRSAADMKPVVQQMGMDWAHVHDAGSKLSQQFGVRGIPNVFLISPDGVVRWNGHPANLDKALATVLEKFPPSLVDPKALKSARETLSQADTKVDSGDAAGALRLMARVPADVVAADADFAKAVEVTRAKLEPAGQKQVESAEGASAAGKHADAARQLREVSLALAGTPVGDDAKQRLDGLKDRPAAKQALDAADKDAPAAAALEAATKLRDAKQHEAAYAKLKQAAAAFPGTPSGDEAAGLVKQYEADAAFMKKLNEKESGGKAKAALSVARSYVNANRRDQAKKKYQQVIADYPDTEYAKTAKAELAKLK